MFENRFELHKLRAAVRGKDQELDDTLLAIRLAAMSYVATAESQLPIDRKRVAEGAEVVGDWLSTTQVAVVADCDERTVRLAASEARLIGEKFDGQWRFTQHDAIRWMATRPRGI